MSDTITAETLDKYLDQSKLTDRQKRELRMELKHRNGSRAVLVKAVSLNGGAAMHKASRIPNRK
jgi:hypothetical protein